MHITYLPINHKERHKRQYKAYHLIYVCRILCIDIDEPLNVDWDGNELLLSDILGTEEDTITRDLEHEAECRVLLKALGRLSRREQMIVRMRFGIGTGDGEEKTQKEVADILGISQSYISRLEKKIMQRLRREMVKYV